VPTRLSLRLVVAGVASLLAALVLITVISTRSAPAPRATAAAGEQAWAVIEHLFHVEGPIPGTSVRSPGPPSPAAPPAAAPGPVVAQLPPAPASPDGGRFAAIDRHATAPRIPPTAAPTPAPVIVPPPLASGPAPTPAPLPAPAPLGPVSALLDAVTSLVSGLLGLLGGG
jgi:hypothetical protein